MTALVKFQSNVKSGAPKKPFVKGEKKEWELVEDGDYVAELKAVEEKTSKAGNKYIQVRFEIKVGEKQEKRLVFTKFIIEHANPNVTRMAVNKLQAMSRVLGSGDLEDTSELNNLIGKKCVIQVVKKEGTGDFKDYNDVKRFIKL